MNKDFNSSQILRTLMRNPIARKVIIVGFVIAIGYIVAQPKLNDWFGWNLPGISGGQQQTVETSPPLNPNPNQKAERDDNRGGKVELEKSPTTEKNSSSKQSSSQPKQKSTSKNQAEATEKPLGELTEIRRGTFESTAGLIFSTNRKEHVLLHAKDDPTRNQSHGVFDGGEKKVFEVLDEAYSLVKEKDKRVYSKREGDRDVHDVDMRRTIGYVGGRTGKRNGYPKVKHVRLVLEDRRVITAFPFKK